MYIQLVCHEQNQLHELYLQEDRYYHSRPELIYNETIDGWTFLLPFVWKNIVNVATWAVKMLLGPPALKSQNSIEWIQLTMMSASFNDNPNTTIDSYIVPPMLETKRTLSSSISSYPSLADTFS